MAIWSALLARPTQTPLSSRPSLTLFFLLVGAFLLTLVPHAIKFPFWVTAVIAVAMLIRIVIEFYRLPLPSLIFSSIIAGIFLGLILIQYGGNIMGRDPGTALTAGLIAIKFYELRGPRDVGLIIFSCFFVVMSALLYEQYLELFVYCLIMMWVLTALLLRVNTGDLPQDHLIRMLGKAGIIFVQALPLALFLFFFCPRYTGVLSLTMEDAKIGITDNVSPGSIAKLSHNGEIAMYVRFGTREIPTANMMYWRALVLWKYSGGAWTPGDLAGAPQSQNLAPSPGSGEMVQDIVLKANNQRWMLALDNPTKPPVNTSELSTWGVLLSGNIVQLATGKLNHMVRYTVTSSQATIEERMNKNERKAALQLPGDENDPKKDEHINQRVKDLADQLHQGLNDSQELDYIAAVMHFFRHGKFTYTIAPGIQGPDWLPVFLFDTKSGFCEHFASAFAVLMRLENIPTRLVVGYLGADYNPYSDIYGVSQSNAHAWDEVWIPSDNLPPAISKEGHWWRVDPTSPINTSGDMGSTSSSADSLDNLASQVSRQEPGFLDNYLPSWAKDSMREMQLRREEMESNWDNLVLSFDPETQIQWAQYLGFGKKASIGLLLACLAAALVCLLVFRKWILRKEPVPPVESLYAAFCRIMARRGMPRAAWEGPLAYTERVAEALPDDKLAIQCVGDLVARPRHGPVPADSTTHENLKSLLSVVTASQTATVSRDKR